MPDVLAVRERPPRFLALAWIDDGRLDAAGEEALGRDLAALHAAGAPAFGAPPPGAPLAGLRLGALALAGAPRRRLARVLRRAPPARRSLRRTPGARRGGAPRGRGAWPSGCRSWPGRPSRPRGCTATCGRGNVLAGADGRARLIDPAAHGGHREVDLAMLRLFGRPAPRTLAAYAEAHPLAPGHEERVGLWQLFPLLVHAALFGGSYGGAADARAAPRDTLRIMRPWTSASSGRTAGRHGRHAAASAPRSRGSCARRARAWCRSPARRAST